MPTMIESLTGVSVNSPFFSNRPVFELFPIHNKPPKKNRVALLYGPNGSGKSTLAQGFREYIDSTTPRTVDVVPMCGSKHWVLSPGARPEKVFVFDEKYVERSVKIQTSGLDAIVLFGEQVQLEQQIQAVMQSIEQNTELMRQQEEDYRKFEDPSNVNSPQYWIASITRILRPKDGWAETDGIKIKKHRTSSGVNLREIGRIGALQPSKSEVETRAEFDQLFVIFSGIDTTSHPVAGPIKPISFDNSIEARATELLNTPIKAPELSQREADLLEAFGMRAISEAKGFLIDPSNTTCPVCLQDISEGYRSEAIQRIESILNREVEDFREKLRKLLLSEIPVEIYQTYSILDATIYHNVLEQIQHVNAAIVEHNNAVQAKIDDPFGTMSYNMAISISDAYIALNKALAQLEESRESYNNVIKSKTRTEATLLRLNDDLANFAIHEAYASLCKQRDAKSSAEASIVALKDKLEELNGQLQQLDAKRKNFQIAADDINQSLEYIFYAKDRLKLVLESDQLYHLKSYGQPVIPEKISCGERNALALCYFFTEIAKGTDARSLYSTESLLIIDDPVSSFDLENRVGILSFLRFKLKQVLTACATNKVLVMTHDISVLFDLEKALEEISKNCAAKGINAEFTLHHLKDKALAKFEYNRHNEYTALLRRVFEYAKNPSPDLEYVIGNVMRRVLEAFSSFSFKMGIEEVSLSDDILAALPDDRARTYFQNSMYRLVLNSESHFKEAVQGAPEMSFWTHLSTAEKQRTARDILCFIYKLNELHILMHLPDAKPDLDQWWANICSPDAKA